MRALVACALAAALPAAAQTQCTPSALLAVHGYRCQKALPNGAAIHWVLSEDQNNVRLRLVTPGAGWAGLGFGQQMVGAEAVIAEGVSSTASPGLYDLTAKARAGVTRRTNSGDHLWMLSTAWGREGGATWVEVTRTVAGGRSPLQLQAGIIFAWHTTSQALIQHTFRGTVFLDLPAGRIGGAGTPSLPPTPYIPPATATPGSVPAACTPSTLTRAGGVPTAPRNLTDVARGVGAPYECMLRLTDWAAIHWTNAATVRFVAVEWATVGWAAVAFPEQAGNMAPADGFTVDANGIVTRVRITGKSRSSIVASNESAPSILNPEVTRIGGKVILRYTESVVTGSGLGGAGLQLLPDAQPVNVARHSGEALVQTRHTDRAGTVVDFASGGLQVVAPAPSRGVKAHGVFMAVWFSVVVPFAMLIKRFGGEGGAAFLVHAGVMGVTLVVVTIWVPIALRKYDSHLDSHRRLGICLLTFIWIQSLMGAAKGFAVPKRPADGTRDPHHAKRYWFSVVHGLFGLCLWIAFIGQAFLGCHVYEERYGTDLPRDLEIVMIVFLGVYACAFLGLTAVSIAKDDAAGKQATEPAEAGGYDYPPPAAGPSDFSPPAGSPPRSENPLPPRGPSASAGARSTSFRPAPTAGSARPAGGGYAASHSPRSSPRSSPRAGAGVGEM